MSKLFTILSVIFLAAGPLAADRDEVRDRETLEQTFDGASTPAGREVSDAEVTLPVETLPREQGRRLHELEKERARLRNEVKVRRAKLTFYWSELERARKINSAIETAGHAITASGPVSAGVIIGLQALGVLSGGLLIPMLVMAGLMAAGLLTAYLASNAQRKNEAAMNDRLSEAIESTDNQIENGFSEEK